jgi:RNA polymerase sigma-54 factor
VQMFLEKLEQSYAHVEQLQSHKYFLIQLYRIGIGILIENFRIFCPARYHKLFLKLLQIMQQNLEDAATYISSLLTIYHEEAEPVSPEEVAHTLRHIQTFAPPGVGARDLEECLSIQARNLDLADTAIEPIIHGYLKEIRQRQYDRIARALDIPLDEVELVAKIIINMSPKPGSDFSSQSTEYIVPDIYVYKVGDEYEVVLNEDELPYLRINPLYKKLILEDSYEVPQDTKQYVDQKLRSAMWFIRSVEQRKRTIYKVGKSIVKFQREFLEHGVTHLKPLVLRDVADDISMHESTVSRVTTNKYIHTPQGVFELKFFFHSGLESSSGTDVSSIAVKERIKQLITGEDRARPLSDKSIEDILKEEGVAIARRTVAKYREELNIPSSLQRKCA